MRMKRKGHSCILVMSDSHFPYGHPDTYKFYEAIAEEYQPDKVIHIGDEVDYHAISFHDSDPNLLSASAELERAIECLQPFYELFPNVTLIDSNHGSLVYRRIRKAGLPEAIVRSYNEILQAPQGWEWVPDLTLRMSDGSPVYFHHGKTSAHGKLSREMGMSTVQGHYHGKFSVDYHGNGLGLYWDMRVGCTIDDESLAFEYNKTTLARPIIGCGIIINGQPSLIPMVLNKKGRWIGKLV